MITKEIIYTKYDARGRVIKRTSTVEVVDSEEDRDRERAESAEFGGIPKASTRRINEAIEDYFMSNDW